MAERGKPIPVSTRLQIREQRQAATVRQVAAALNISPTTVQKYRPKFGTGSATRGGA